MKIHAVQGAIDTSEMGLTLMHEHIINIEWNFARTFSGFYDREAVVELFCQEMETLKPLGVRTVVDATPITLGRDVRLMQECSERAQVNILACTGLYWQEHPFFYMGVDPNVLADLMIREIEHGMEGSDAKPALIKCASQLVTGPSENNRNMLLAAAMASKATGLPIYTHTDPASQLGRFQKSVFDEAGVDPAKVAYGHVFSTLDRAYLQELAVDGSYIGCDQLAFSDVEGICSARNMADFLAELLNSDLRRRIFLSCDAAVRSDFGLTLSPLLRDRSRNPMVLKNRRREVLFEELLPDLRERGVTDEAIHEVLFLNPRRYFGEQI